VKSSNGSQRWQWTPALTLLLCLAKGWTYHPIARRFWVLQQGRLCPLHWVTWLMIEAGLHACSALRSLPTACVMRSRMQPPWSLRG
jgi:hypothetical protein